METYKAMKTESLLNIKNDVDKMSTTAKDIYLKSLFNSFALDDNAFSILKDYLTKEIVSQSTKLCSREAISSSLFDVNLYENSKEPSIFVLLNTDALPKRTSIKAVGILDAQRNINLSNGQQLIDKYVDKKQYVMLLHILNKMTYTVGSSCLEYSVHTNKLCVSDLLDIYNEYCNENIFDISCKIIKDYLKEKGVLVELHNGEEDDIDELTW